MNVFSKTSEDGREHMVICKDECELALDHVLTTLSAVKGKLMADIAPIHIQTIICKMTPSVRKNIVTASKKLEMYGKKMPIIARFDEFANRLPDEIEIGTSSGITLQIVDPQDYGEFYLELNAIEFPSSEYTSYRTDIW